MGDPGTKHTINQPCQFYGLFKKLFLPKYNASNSLIHTPQNVAENTSEYQHLDCC